MRFHGAGDHGVGFRRNPVRGRLLDGQIKEWEDRAMKRSLPPTAGQDRAVSPDRTGFPSLAESPHPHRRLSPEALVEGDAIQGLEERYGIREEGLF